MPNTAVLHTNIAPFINNQFLNIFSNKKSQNWISGELIQVNTIRKYLNNRYISMNTATTGSTAPTHLSGTQSDGSVDWLFIESDTDDDFYDNNLYLFVGKPTPWDDESNPDVAVNYPVNEKSTLIDALFFKKLQSSDVKMAIRRYNWEPSTIYSEYDSTKNFEDYTSPFYVINSELNIYKCLSNNGNIASVAEPTGKEITEITTTDGYVWKFMATVDSNDASNFLTADFIPIQKKLQDDGSVQWDVQQSAKSGSISSINVANGGSGYDNVPTVVVTPTSGENITTPLVATAEISGGSITGIIINDSGEGYITPPLIQLEYDTTESHGLLIKLVTDSNGTITSINITGEGRYPDGVSNIIINTANGTGANIAPIFDETTKLIGFNIISGGVDYVDDETVSLNDNSSNIYSHDVIIDSILAPADGHGSNVITELSARSIIINMRLEQDELGFLSDTAEFRQIGIVVDPIVADNTLPTATRYYGAKSDDYGSNPANDIKSGSGYLIYHENIEVITRTPNQIQEIKLVLNF